MRASMADFKGKYRTKNKELQSVKKRTTMARGMASTSRINLDGVRQRFLPTCHGRRLRCLGDIVQVWLL